MYDAYREDLAYIHDVGFGDLAKNAAPVLLDALPRSGIHRGVVVDLCCGSGLLTQDLSAAGYRVVGIDISEALLDIARARVPSAHFCQESILRAEIPPCVAVAAIGECFNYLFDEDNSRQELRALLRRIHGSLDEGGVLIFDLAEPGRVPPGTGVQRAHAEAEDWAVLMTAKEDRRNRELTRRITTLRKVGELYRRDQETHRLRLVPRSEILEELGDLGFEVQILDRYGQLQFPSRHTGFLARKI
jgi:SAM-dependent methyltransferase